VIQAQLGSDRAGTLGQQANRGDGVQAGRCFSFLAGTHSGPFGRIERRYGGIRGQRERAYGPAGFAGPLRQPAAPGAGTPLGLR